MVIYTDLIGIRAGRKCDMDNHLIQFSTLYESGHLTVSLSMAVYLVLIILIALIAYLIYAYRNFFSYRKVKLKTIKLKLLGSEAEFVVESNHSNLEIANKILVELITRKAAIPIEEDKDVITEVYDSWYQLFCTTREEIKSINGEHLRHPNSEALVEMATDVLNKGLRPHLTEFQARFRRWYGLEILKEENQNLSPQEIQKKFSDYDELINSMKDVNQILVQYANELKAFIYS